MSRYKLSEKKLEFACYYFSDESETRYNYYRSALKAGFSDSYARKIMCNMNWTELALMAEDQGFTLLDDSSREYAQRCQKTMENVGK
jgi:hypothetical protein